MKRETKNRLFALFVLFTFIGGSAALAIMSAFEPAVKPSVQLAYTKPLANEEEASFFRENKIVLKYFTSDDCGKPCEDASLLVSDLFQRMQGSMVVETISIDDYPDEAARYDIAAAPYFVFRGKTEAKLNGSATYDELVATACGMFFSENDVCIT
ncbi:MAG: thioredoxin family protein [Candidatus Aenigmatarchaeota archaeon]